MLSPLSRTNSPQQPANKQENNLQAEFVEVIMNRVSCGVLAVAAIRKADSTIQDFQVTAVNEQAALLVNLQVADMIGRELGTLFPGIYSTGIFEFYTRSVETGIPDSKEMHYDQDGLDIWVCLETQKLGDGLVITWTDIGERKRTELTVRDQRIMLEAIIQHSTSMIDVMEAVYTPDGIIEDFVFRLANQTSLAKMGLSEQQVIGHRLRDLFPAVVERGVFDQLVAVVETGQTYQNELNFQANGDEVWLNVKYIRHGSGVISITFDLTPMKLAKREKLRQGALLQTITDHTQAGIELYEIIPNATGHLTDLRVMMANPASERSAKRPVGELVGRTVLSERPEIKDTLWWEYMLACAHTGEPQHFVYPYDQEGSSGWFDISFVRHENIILSTFLDVTLLKGAELAQQRNAELLEEVMKATPTAIAVHESIRDNAGELIDFRLTQLNQMAADLLKQPIKSVQNQLLSVFFPGVQQTFVFKKYQRVLQTGEPIRIELPRDDRWYDLSVTRFGDGLIVVVVDITHLRAHQRQLEVINLELKRSNESLRSFAYIASHDLQEPLRKLTSFSEILHKQYAQQLDATAADIIGRINISAGRMKLLIQDLLQYAQIDTKPAAFKSVDLSRLIRELEDDELWALLNQHAGKLVLNTLPTITGDSVQMRQLFQNLLSNAVKFCRKNVPPVVSISSRIIDRNKLPTDLLSPDQLAGMASASSSFYELAIADNGIGFDPKYIDRIFQVFQRLHGRMQFSGSGIGLAICHKIVERHGGAITARSTPGEGSTFLVYLPVQAAR